MSCRARFIKVRVNDRLDREGWFRMYRRCVKFICGRVTTFYLPNYKRKNFWK